MNEKLYRAVKDAAEKISAASEFYGRLAMRKVNAISTISDLEALMEVASDLELIASKLID